MQWSFTEIHECTLLSSFDQCLLRHLNVSTLSGLNIVSNRYTLPYICHNCNNLLLQDTMGIIPSLNLHKHHSSRVYKYSFLTEFLCSPGPGDVSLSLNGTLYQNNSLVNLEDIGLDDNALLCTTANTECCSRTESPGGAILGQWFYPNGSAVADRIVDVQGDMWEFYRTRGPSIVLLNRRRGGVTGIYGCLIPDTLNTDQPLYIGLYTANTGELIA